MDRFRLMPNYRYYSAEGASPLSITDSIGKPLRNYRIYGSDGGVGDKSKNLFDNQRAIEYADEVTSYMYSYFKFENGKTYTMSCTSKSEDTTNKKWFRAGTLDTSRITLNTLGYKSVTFTIPNDGVDYYLRVYDNGTPSKLQYLRFFDGTYMENLQIEEGSAATEYEPYWDGYNIPVTVSNEQSIPLKTYNIYLDEPLAEGECIDYINGIGLPRIQIGKGTNIITVDTEIKPSNIEVQYYK